MSAPRTFVAPGKIMLAGEYAVLGATGEALAVAVDAGVACDATPAAGGAWEIVRAESGVAWREGAAVPEELRFAQAAWAAARDQLAVEDAAAARALAPHRLVLRIRGGAGTGDVKPGVGGSASATAVTAAAVLGLAGYDARAGRRTLLALALRVHREVQRGAGSGYDVATVVHGGLVHWRRGEATKLPWPAGLCVLAAYSGRSAHTVGFIEKVDALRAADATALDGELEALAVPVRAFVAALRDADVSASLHAVHACHHALVLWDAARDIGIVTPAIARLCALASSCGAAPKVSGAGGGDSVLAFAAEPAILDEVSRAWTTAGFRPFAVTRVDDGVHEAHT